MLTVLSLAISAFVLWLLWRTPLHHSVARFGYTLIVAGAIGNLIDRVSLGYVVDYFRFHTDNWSFAIFNMADAFITIGAAFAILQEFIIWRKSRERAGRGRLTAAVPAADSGAQHSGGTAWPRISGRS